MFPRGQANGKSWNILLGHSADFTHQEQLTHHGKHYSTGECNGSGGNFPNSEKIIPDDVIRVFLAWASRFHIFNRKSA